MPAYARIGIEFMHYKNRCNEDYTVLRFAGNDSQGKKTQFK